MRVAQAIGHAQLLEDLDRGLEVRVGKDGAAFSLLDLTEEDAGFGLDDPLAGRGARLPSLMQLGRGFREVSPSQLDLAQADQDVAATPAIDVVLVGTPEGGQKMLLGGVEM